MGRWFFTGFGLLFWFRLKKRNGPKLLKQLILISLSLLILEFAWNKVNEARLHDVTISQKVSLLTHNILFNNKDSQSVINNIKKENPDVLLIQELTPYWRNRLNKSIGNKYRYKETLALNGTHGIGVYSKFPINSNQFIPSSRRPIAQKVELTIGDKKIKLINAHLASPGIAVENPDNFVELFHKNYLTREQQFKMINELANKDEFDAQILIGDLNTTRFEPIYRDLKKHWVNMHDEVGNGLGLNFPNSYKMPTLITLDYIMLRGKIKPKSIRVIDGGSSDHLAIYGEIEL